MSTPPLVKAPPTDWTHSAFLFVAGAALVLFFFPLLIIAGLAVLVCTALRLPWWFVGLALVVCVLALVKHGWTLEHVQALAVAYAQVQQATALAVVQGQVVDWTEYAQQTWTAATTGGIVAGLVLALVRPSFLLPSRAAGRTGPAGRVPLHLVDADRLANTKAAAIQWAVPQVLGSGILTIVGAAPKVGKSWWTFALLRAMQDEAPFYGLPTTRQRVLYCTEETAPSFAEKVKHFGVTKQTLVALHHHTVQGWPWAALVAEVGRLAKRHRCGVVVVDTLATWTPAAERQTETVAEAIAPLRALTAQGLAVLVIHHDRKSGGEAGAGLRGHSSLAAAVDVIVDLDRGDAPDVRCFATYGRHGELTCAGRLVGVRYEPLTLPTTPIAAEEPKAETPPPLSPELAEVVAYLRGCGETGATGPEITAALGIPKQTVSRRLNALRERALVDRAAAGKGRLRWFLVS